MLYVIRGGHLGGIYLGNRGIDMTYSPREASRDCISPPGMGAMGLGPWGKGSKCIQGLQAYVVEGLPWALGQP